MTLTITIHWRVLEVYYYSMHACHMLTCTALHCLVACCTKLVAALNQYAVDVVENWVGAWSRPKKPASKVPLPNLGSLENATSEAKHRKASSVAPNMPWGVQHLYLPFPDTAFFLASSVGQATLSWTLQVYESLVSRRYESLATVESSHVMSCHHPPNTTCKTRGPNQFAISHGLAVDPILKRLRCSSFPLPLIALLFCSGQSAQCLRLRLRLSQVVTGLS